VCVNQKLLLLLKFFRNLIIRVLGEKLANIIFKIRRFNYVSFTVYKFFGYIYIIHNLYLKIFYKFKIVNLNSFKVYNLNSIDNNFLKQVKKDLQIKNFFFANFKDKIKYLCFAYPKRNLTDTDYAWGFNKIFYIAFLEKNLGKEIRSLYNGLNYRVENIEIWRDYKYGNKITNNFHIDGDLPGAIKIMIYLSDVDMNSGPLEIKIENKIIPIQGKKGSAIIFRNNKLLHRGAFLKNKERTVITYIIYPTAHKNIFYNSNKPVDVICSLNPFTKYS